MSNEINKSFNEYHVNLKKKKISSEDFAAPFLFYELTDEQAVVLDLGHSCTSLLSFSLFSVSLSGFVIISPLEFIQGTQKILSL